MLPTTIAGSYPKLNWYTQNLPGRAFKVAMVASLFREQYLDAVAGILTEQSMARSQEEIMGGLRFDPSQTSDDLLQALERAAEAAWGAEALPDLLASLKITAQAIWLINQEPFAPGDLEP